MNSKLVALFGRWCNADAIRIFVHADIPTKERDAGMPEELVKLGEFSSSFSRLSVWYSLLYVVLEGYRELKLADPEVDALLEKCEYVESLRTFRNATFHYQKDPLSDKAMTFLTAADSEAWIRRLNHALDRYFLVNLPIREQIESMKERIPKPPEG
jgi:hypothetical protein